MKTDSIRIDNRANGFERAIEETRKAAAYRGLGTKETVQLQILAEEMLSLARSVTGEMTADFWLESEGTAFDLRMRTKTVMDREKREALLSAATSRKNEAAGTFLGRIRDAFEEAMTAEPDHRDPVPDEVWKDIVYAHPDDPEWDGYERSILKKLADAVRVSIRGGSVELTVTRRFA